MIVFLLGLIFQILMVREFLLSVEKRMNQTPEIINAFSGEDARTLYKLLTTKTGTDAK